MSNFLKNIHPLLKRKRKTLDPYYVNFAEQPTPAPDDPNFAVLNAIDTTLKDTETETIQSKLQSFLHTATGSYLNHWGSWFGTYRHELEHDIDYRDRIIGSVSIERGTLNALQTAIDEYLNADATTVTIHEPFKNMFRLNHSALNGDDHLTGDIYRYGVVLVDVNNSYTEDLLKLLQEYKPAGVLIIINLNKDDDTTSIDVYTGQALAGLIDVNQTYYID